jgi:ubiquinone/menaquinone biosynthesis C-methylase UbiE
VSKHGQEEYVAREFDRSSKSYDKSRLVKSYQRRAQTLVINKMQIERGMNILDLGCGTGWGTIDIASRLQGTGKVVGLDLSEKMIEQAKRKLAKFTYGNVEFRVGSGISLHYENYYDYVLSTNAFHHFDKKEEIFSRIWKSLKSNGVFIVQDICDDYFLMKIVDLAGKIGEKAHVGSSTSEGLRNLFISTGFVNIEVEKAKFNWFWRIMIGKGIKKDSKAS